MANGRIFLTLDDLVAACEAAQSPADLDAIYFDYCKRPFFSDLPRDLAEYAMKVTQVRIEETPRG